MVYCISSVMFWLGSLTFLAFKSILRSPVHPVLVQCSAFLQSLSALGLPDMWVYMGSQEIPNIEDVDILRYIFDIKVPRHNGPPTIKPDDS